MGLKLESIQAVEMDGKPYLPTISTESSLKLQDVKLDTEVHREEAIETMAECFPGHASEVKNFLKRCAVPMLARLQSYLIAGQDGVEMVNRRLEEAGNTEPAKDAKEVKDDA